VRTNFKWIRFDLVSQWVKDQYTQAAKSSTSFLLSNAAETKCDRPYALRGKNLMDLTGDDVQNVYDEKLDTTTAAPMETSTESTSGETTTPFDFSKVRFEVRQK
jgi:hypothetical protein